MDGDRWKRTETDGDGQSPRRAEMEFWLTKVMRMNIEQGKHGQKDPVFGVEDCTNEKNLRRMTMRMTVMKRMAMTKGKWRGG